MLEVINGEAKHPCGKECVNRCAGCKISCVDLLEYNLLYKQERFKYKVGSWVAKSAKKSGYNEYYKDKSKRKFDTQYYIKHNSNQPIHI